MYGSGIQYGGAAFGGRGKHGLAHLLSSNLDVAGLAAFLLLALAGLGSGVFFLNFLSKGEAFRLISAGVIPLMNLAIGVKVAASVFLAFIVLAAVRLEPEASDEDEVSSLEEAE